MTPETLKNAIIEAQRFLKAAKAVKIVGGSRIGAYNYPEPGKVTAACRRASMDLTRALAEMRKPE